MIDDKKIEEAARKRLNAFREANPDGYSSSIIDIESDCLDNFKAGAHWAIQEFLKSLWHPISEEPKIDGKEILFDARMEGHTCSLIYKYLKEQDATWTYDKVRSLGNWAKVSIPEDTFQAFKWLYIDDLLPKQKGGEQ